MRDSPRVIELSSDECWDLLTHTKLGRLAVATDTGVDMFPVNYLVYDRAIYFSSAPGNKLVEITARRHVAFEIDGRDGRMLWSVIVRGEAHRLGVDAEIEDSGVLELDSWSPGDKWNHVRIIPEVVTGRRFRKRNPPRSLS